MIELNNLSFKYNDHIIFNNTKIKINDSGMTAITGESGCGKSTLLKIITKQIKVDSNCFKEDIPKDDIIYIDQYATLDEELSITKHFELYSTIYQQEYNEQRVKECLEYVNLSDIDTSKATSLLSSGERKRVAIALALYVNPRLIILDEPTSSLDYEIKKEVYDLLKRISKDHSVLISTHDTDFNDYFDNIYKIENEEIHLVKETNKESNHTNISSKKALDIKKLHKYQGKKTRRSIILTGLCLFVILHILSYQAVDLFYSNKNTDTVTNALTKNVIYTTFEHVSRSELPSDYEYISYTDTGAIIDEESVEKIKDINHVVSVKPYYCLNTTNVSTPYLLNDIDDTKSHVEIVKDGQTLYSYDLRQTDTSSTPAMVSYYKEENVEVDGTQIDGNFVDESAASKLNIKSSDLPVTLNIEVDVPVCNVHTTKDFVLYYENGEPYGEKLYVEMDEVAYNKVTVSVQIDHIVSSSDYASYFDVGSLGLIYVEGDELQSIVEENQTTDVEDKLDLIEELDSSIKEYTPTNYAVLVDSVDNLETVQKEIQEINERFVTYIPSSNMNDVVDLRNTNQDTTTILYGLYIILSVSLIIIILYRFNKMYLKKSTFYYNLGLANKDIKKLMNIDIQNIVILFVILNTIICAIRMLSNSELYVNSMYFNIGMFAIVSVVFGIALYIINNVIEKRTFHD